MAEITEITPIYMKSIKSTDAVIYNVAKTRIKGSTLMTLTAIIFANAIVMMMLPSLFFYSAIISMTALLLSITKYKNRSISTVLKGLVLLNVRNMLRKR